jgi:hypothetical protein
MGNSLLGDIGAQEEAVGEGALIEDVLVDDYCSMIQRVDVFGRVVAHGPS